MSVCRCGVAIKGHRQIGECAGDPRHPEQTVTEIGFTPDLRERVVNVLCHHWSRYGTLDGQAEHLIALVRSDSKGGTP